VSRGGWDAAAAAREVVRHGHAVSWWKPLILSLVNLSHLRTYLMLTLTYSLLTLLPCSASYFRFMIKLTNSSSLLSIAPKGDKAPLRLLLNNGIFYSSKQ
jgi:hypothetical protein